MAESSSAVDLRLTVPADTQYREIASELAEKFAEYAGADKHAAAAFGEAVGRMSLKIANGSEPMLFEMLRDPAVVTVRVSSGARHDETTCALPA